MVGIWERLTALFGGDEPLETIFQEEWRGYLRRNLPLYERIPPDLQERVHRKIARFVETTQFVACEDLELTEEMVLTVAGQACVLVANHAGEPYPQLRTVFLYPSSYLSSHRTVDLNGVVTDHEVECDGTSSSDGWVILAWDSVLHGARDIRDGKNVTFHEFAHQLDQDFGAADGLPRLAGSQAYETWAEVLGASYERLVQRAEKGRKSIFDHYGATNPAEFFAVATETFFEKPRQMNQRHPELYRELQNYFQLDPLQWHAARY